MFGKWCLKAARSHKLKTTVSNKEIRIWKEKTFEETVVSRNFLLVNSNERFLAPTQNHMNTEEMLRAMTRHTLEAIFKVMRAAVKL